MASCMSAAIHGVLFALIVLVVVLISRNRLADTYLTTVLSIPIDLGKFRYSFFWRRVSHGGHHSFPNGTSQEHLGTTMLPQISRRLADPRRELDMTKMLWVFISGSIENNGENFDNRIVPHAETWLAHAPVDTVFAVFADNNSTRAIVLARKSCKQFIEHTVERDHSVFRGRTLEYVCRTKGSNVHVIVSSCPDGYGHKQQQELGPLCKWDAALAHLAATGRLQKASWIQLSDDDVYVQTDPMMQLLAKADPRQPLFVNNIGSPGRTNICPWNKKLHACNKDVPQCACWAMFSSGLAAKFLVDQRKGGIKRLAAGLGAGTDSIGPAYAWLHGAKFLPAGPYYRNHPLERGYSNTPGRVIIFHGLGVRTPVEIQFLHHLIQRAWQKPNHMERPKLQPGPWKADIAGRDYKGADDACNAAFEVSTPKESYWWLDESRGFRI